MRTTRSVLAPTVALVAVLGMTGCTQVSSSGSKTSGSGASSSAQETKSADSSASASETSSESPSESTSESSSESSDSSSSSSESSESSSSSSSVSDVELMRFAEENTVRACKTGDVDYVSGGGRFCESDSDVIAMDYSGQRIYVTVATKYEPGAKYTYSGHVGNDTKTNQPITITGTARAGAPLTLAVPAQSDGAATLTVSFAKNGKQFASKTVKLEKH